MENPLSFNQVPVNIEDEMKRSYIDYAMSVIIGRALPDVRDGLKPVHTRILYAMYDGGFRPDRGFFKCSRVVGDVMGNYHPHGDSAIYDALVRMAHPRPRLPHPGPDRGPPRHQGRLPDRPRLDHDARRGRGRGGRPRPHMPGGQ